jgi:hypothetical protein
VYWGDARWGRAQLLGEIARGGWVCSRNDRVFAHAGFVFNREWPSILGANIIKKCSLPLTSAAFIQGMCRGEALDVFPEDALQHEGSGPAPTSPDNLWEFLTAGDRLAFAPKNEMMSDDEEACLARLLAVAAAVSTYLAL